MAKRKSPSAAKSMVLEEERLEPTHEETLSEELLRADKLVKSYGGRRVVNQISITVSRGEIVGLLGKNGAGKTTTFYMLVGLLRPDSGRVFFAGRDVTKEPMFKRARLGMGYLSQEPSVFRNLTVRDNIMAILQTLPMDKTKRERRLRVLLDELGIAHLAGQKAYTLSGGERRRLEISRALVTHPSFLMLDEPFSGGRSNRRLGSPGDHQGASRKGLRNSRHRPQRPGNALGC